MGSTGKVSLRCGSAESLVLRCVEACVCISVRGTKNVLARLPRAVSSVSRDDFQPQGLDQRENLLNAVVVDLARDLPGRF
jgi:hypothetical protein